MLLEQTVEPRGDIVSIDVAVGHLGLIKEGPLSSLPALRPYLDTVNEVIDGNPLTSWTHACFRPRTLRLTVDLLEWENVFYLPGSNISSVDRVQCFASETPKDLPTSSWRLRERYGAYRLYVDRPPEFPEEGDTVRIDYRAGSDADIPKPVSAAALHHLTELWTVRSYRLDLADGWRHNMVTRRLLAPFVQSTNWPRYSST